MGFTGTATATNDPQTDANFRAWGSMISTKLGQCGLVQTADTGQINWTTVVHPTVTNTAAGYEIWRFADALQATAPVFLRIEYGIGGNPGFPAIFVQVSNGSDGSGNLTGVPSTKMFLRGYVAHTTNVPSYFCGDTGRVVMTLWPNGSQGNNATVYFSMERTVDAAGAPTAVGVLITGREGAVSGGWQQQAWLPTGPATAIETSMGSLAPAASSASGGGQFGVFPVLHTKGDFFNPGLSGLGYFLSDITALAPVSFTMYGALHTFLPMGSTMLTPVQRATGSTTGLLMRWE